ncbi:unnamed protein product [Plutella xylostella]|uniref:(diamondback moth) hypothetical protein n=1 Tax=Plutella xylostella TaxID=51655 RepID=A0A8S4G7W8_PLUXY|nr:unnamed protein product [Plutella xylostella]
MNVTECPACRALLPSNKAKVTSVMCAIMNVTECPACRAHLPSNKAKVHCRHCGRIFCGACVRGEVAAGPRRRPARVCAVCRTLLQPHTPPYFSTAPPTNTD